MRSSRFLVCLILSLLGAAAAPAADQFSKRLYLPGCVFPSIIPQPDDKTTKLAFCLSLPVKPLGLDWPAFAAQKDKTPAERFVADVFAAVADGTLAEKHLSGLDGAYPSLAEAAKREDKEHFFKELRLEWLARFDGEYMLFYCVGHYGWHCALHFREDGKGGWRLVNHAPAFRELLAVLWAAAVRRGEKDALFTDPGLPCVVGVNFNEDQWQADVMTPGSEFKAHFAARPLDCHFSRPAAPDEKDPLLAAMRAYSQANPKDCRLAEPLLVVDMGAMAWVIYDWRPGLRAGYRPLLRSAFFQKTADGAWRPVGRHDMWPAQEIAFQLMAINVLNAARPMPK